MEQTVVSIRMDKIKKEQFDTVADMMGITTTALFNIFVERVIATKALPFSLEVPINPWYHKELRMMAEMKKRNKNLAKEAGLKSEDDIMEWIYAERRRVK